MTDRIALQGISVTACHGVLDSEKVEPQPFRADIVLETDLRRAGESDDLDHTISYAEIAQEAERVLSGPSVDLIETLAERIAAIALARPTVEAVEVAIHKPQAPAGVPFRDPVLDGPSVTVRREQDRPVVIAAGANLGDRAATLRAAVQALVATEGLELVRVSPLVETDPVGGPDQPDYANAVIIARSRLAPATLLRRLHQIESWHGRTREIRWGARTLDLDLIQVGDPADGHDLTSDDEALTLPHPRAHERAFVLVPWLAADAEARLRTPEGVQRVADLLADLDVSGVRPGPDWEPW
ncbi:2-amino-4-hydroxy-6-hydroxymethyldihydropteridine diphosphokinase [Luteipulveratus halotolerans]|uniref:Bifunctional folate synthesis protein n=1 Tax=Luteipulveratus halotolerans TaxID=1631356 RepID=A0A0L6CF64_9MICO|nr:2-amino-4-hydroxy-6-hydroxymethyldihydropteridine diphosphokinase [Luteipulveratus halotolerans]KNX36158.1 2-amino-4-hydroxy-6-hydroxymethyldihydropteridine pyrophosphokinase [Luteipulveratus halotolerans]